MHCKILKKFAVNKYIGFFFSVTEFAYVHMCLSQVLYSGIRIIFHHIRSCVENRFAWLPEQMTNKFQITR